MIQMLLSQIHGVQGSTDIVTVSGQWDLAGLWTSRGAFATLGEVPGSISYRFHARDLRLILTPQARGHGSAFK
jgi:hypothetical protein